MADQTIKDLLRMFSPVSRGSILDYDGLSSKQTSLLMTAARASGENLLPDHQDSQEAAKTPDIAKTPTLKSVPSAGRKDDDLLSNDNRQDPNRQRQEARAVVEDVLRDSDSDLSEAVRNPTSPLHKAMMNPLDPKLTRY